MKKNLIAVVIAFAAFLTGTGDLNAQTLSNTGTSVFQKSIDAEVEKTASYAKESADEKDAISPRALKNFSRTYKNVTGESWLKVKDGFSARFNLDDVFTTIFYDNKGQWEGSLKYYKEEQMLAGMRSIVKSTYYDYNIIYVQEAELIESNKIPTYIICIADKNTIKYIRMFDREMEVWKELMQAN